MDRHCDISCLSRELFSDGLRHGPGEQVRRSRLDADFREHHGARRLGRILILGDHLLNPGNLPGDVEVVRAILGTCLEGVLAVLKIRTDGGDENERLLGQSLQVSMIQAADLDFYKIVVISA